MSVRRLVPNLASNRPRETAAFWRDLFGLDTAMDMDFIVTLCGEIPQQPQVSLMSEGGSGTPVPDVSVEVDDLDEVLARARERGLLPEYGPVSEPWGVRRFYLRDPGGRLLNVLTHEDQAT